MRSMNGNRYDYRHIDATYAATGATLRESQIKRGEVSWKRETTTLPTVTTAQNGPNSAGTYVLFFDDWGIPEWMKDGDGFLSYIETDRSTGSIKKIIDDVDTDETGDFANKPSGWTNSAGSHLKTTYDLDNLGRATKETAANGNIHYCHRALQNQPPMGASKPAGIQRYTSTSVRPFRSVVFASGTERG